MSNQAANNSRYMYNVMVLNEANAVFDTANEALRFAMHHVYLGPNGFAQAEKGLENGEKFSYCYGFASVDIVPVRKRTVGQHEAQHGTH